MTEQAIEWRRIPFAPMYEVSSAGDVRRSMAGVSTFAGRVLRQWKESNGYLRVTLRIKDRSQKHWVQRLVALAFHGDPPTPKHQAAHGDGNRSNNRSDNLRWATRVENSDDSARHGTRVAGERSPHAKLTAADVVNIRSRYIGRRGQLAALCREYGVTVATMHNVVNRKTWVNAGAE